MKKQILFCTLIIWLGISPSYGQMSLKAGFDFAGLHTAESESNNITYHDKDVNSSASFALEYLKNINMFGIGIGAGYQKASLKDSEANLNIIPIYLVFRIKHDLEIISPYFKVQGGYPFVIANDEYKQIYNLAPDPGVLGESCYSFGCGVEKEKYFIELLYNVNKGGLGTGGTYPSTHIQYSKFGLYAGFTFR